MAESALDPSVAGTLELSTQLREVVGRLKRRLREETPTEEFSWSQVSLVAALERQGPSTVTRLARGAGMRPQSMGSALAPLLDAGLARSDPDPEDGRQQLLSVTATGRSWLRARRARADDWLVRTISSRLTRREQATLASALALLQRVAEP